jgi:proteasome beta subunit
MTLILALACADGIVMASDGQATFSTTGQPVKQPMQKIHSLASCVLWAGAGDVGLLQKIGYALEPVDADKLALPIRELRPVLFNTVRPAMVEAVQAFIPVGPNPQPPLADLLFCGYCGHDPWILEISRTASDVQHEETGFAAIGSADIFPYFALTSLAHYGVRERSTVEGQLIAYRVLDDAINTVAYGIGPPIQISIVDRPSHASQPGQARPLSIDELRALQEAVTAWKKTESDTLTETLGLGPPEGPPASLA